MESILNWWKRILGFKPEKQFRLSDIDRKCYNCESDSVEEMKASSWCAKWRCNDCRYYNYVVYQDRMGGALTDDVAVSLINNEEF